MGQTEVAQKNLPEGMKDTQVLTKVTDLSKVFKEKLDQMKDLATMEVMLDAPIRMKHRMTSIKDESSAKSYKVKGHWKTAAPKMHITKLEGKKINNDECEITFGIYQMDKDGNKVPHHHYADIPQADGKVIKKITSSEYRVAYEVTEKIKTGKPITREVIKINLIKGVQ